MILYFDEFKTAIWSKFNRSKILNRFKTKNTRLANLIKVFGELAILYHCKRTATIMTREKCRIWSLNRTTFQHIIKTSGKEELDKRLAYLSTVDKLKFLTTRNLHKIVDLLEEEDFEEGDHIIHQGESTCHSGSIKIACKLYNDLIGY